MDANNTENAKHQAANEACRYCEQDSRSGWIYCRSCGTPLTSEPVPALVPDAGPRGTSDPTA
jgi:hypothetical protein